ncbi:TonB-dependent receptor, partial [Brevundimonas sp.]
FKTGLAVRYSGETFNNDANTVVMDEYTLVDLRLAYPVSDQVELYGRVENLFDEEYQTAKDYGTAGRGVFGGVRVKF